MNADKTGKLIKEIRKEKGLTQKELASALHITDKAVSKWETGKSMPDSYLMSELCDKLDISLSELLSGERGSTDAEIKDNIGLIMDLLDREKAQKAKTLNWYFLLGLLFLLPVLFYEHLVLLGFWKAPLQEIDKLGLWIGLGLFFEAAPRANHVGPQGKSRGPPGAITWAHRGNHEGTQGQSRGPPAAIRWAPRGNHVGPQGK